MKKLIFILIIVHCTLTIDNCLSQWEQVSNGMGNITVRALAISGNNIFAGASGTGVSGVYLSTNNGTNWSQVFYPIIYSLAVNGSYIFAGGVGIYLSTNNGTNWSNCFKYSYNVYSLAVNGNYIFAGTYHAGVYKSANNGTNWTYTGLGAMSTDVVSLLANGNNMFAGVDRIPHPGYYPPGIYFYNRASWSPSGLISQHVFSLALNGGIIFAGTAYNGGVFKSTDNGTSWSQTSLNNQTVRSLAVSEYTIFAGTNTSGVFISNNYGVSWIQRNEGLGNLSVWSFCILNNYIYAGTSGGVYKRPLGELVGIQPVSNEIPSQFSLSQNYPNPFNPMTNVKFQMPRLRNGQANEAFVKLIVFDVLGREAAILVNEELKPGTYEVNWDASNFPSGVYYYKLSAGNYTETKKMVLLK